MFFGPPQRKNEGEFPSGASGVVQRKNEGELLYDAPKGTKIKNCPWGPLERNSEEELHC